MPIIETAFEQQSEQWFKARLGNPGASEIKNIVTSEGKPSKTRKDFLFDMADQKVRGVVDDTYQSEKMLLGQQNEAEARALFELIKGVDCVQVGMVFKDKHKLFHASPDFLVGDDAGGEIKCPAGKTHAKYLYENRVPPKYVVQVQSSLYICERKYWWFMSYCSGHRPLIIRVERDEPFIAKLKFHLDLFCKELEVVVGKIK